VRYVALCVVLAIALGCSSKPADSSADRTNPEVQSNPGSGTPDSLLPLAKSHAIKIVTANPVFPVKSLGGEIDGKQADAQTIDRFARIFATEFGLYPPELTKRAKLKRVVIASELKFSGQLRTAIPDWANDTLYLDAARGADNKNYVRKVIHHEFFHIIDFRDDGLVFKDERWANLNPKDFKYGSGGKNAQDIATTSVLTDKYPGFLNHYSTTGVEEDKAEIFANLLVDGHYVDERTNKDPVLKAKTERMRELLKSFCLEANDEFWDKSRRLQREP
jgi:Putative zinc-binding metallo-peptidase